MEQVALVGCAHIHTPGFVERLSKRTDIKTKWIWDHESVRSTAHAGKLGARSTPDIETIWNDPEVSAVIICPETDRHEAMVDAAIRARKHLFVEKPLGFGAADAFRMADAIERSGLLFQTGYFQRSKPIYRFLKDEIAKGHFGKITRGRFANCHAGALKGWFDGEWRWMADQKIAGCGAYGDMGAHTLDIALWLLGEVDSVTAVISPAINRYGGCDEFGEGLVAFKSGAVASVAASWVDLANPVPIYITGTEGWALVRDEQLFYCSSHVPGADGLTPWQALPQPLEHAFELFLDAVCGQGNVPLVSPGEAATRSAVMEALYAGAATKSWVRPSTGK